ncbi:MAG: ATP-binding protein [Anaerolineales bacterium]
MPKDTRTCPNCGVDLALLALLAERAYLDGFPDVGPIGSTPAALVPKIGEYLLDQGLISSVQLDKALERQQTLADQGKRQLLGQTLIMLGFVDRETLDRAITSQIIELHAALQEANRTLERRVTERTSELRRALERLTELNQIKANLISNVSHELRTPLAHIKGYVELVAEEQLGPISEEQEKALAVVQRASERLERLIEDLIEFSSASRGGIRLSLERVDVIELAEMVLKNAGDKAQKAGVSLAARITPELPPLRADRERLGWVLHQLVDNGIKFTPSGGRVEIEAHQEGDLIELEVRDSGIGIPDERKDEIFEPFHQLDGSATRRYGGTGLGLALVRLILEAHGTEMEVTSSEGEGSSFGFVLPIWREQP